MRDLVAAGVMHRRRDIKPDNAPVTYGGGLKLAVRLRGGHAGEVAGEAVRGVSGRHAALDLHLARAARRQRMVRPGGGHVGAGVHHIVAENLTGGPLFDDSSDETMLKEMADMHARPARGHGDVFDERPELSPAGREVLDRWDAGLQPRREDDGNGGAGPQVVH
uniref:Uncharacterized protein n=1 Tax=Oryza rufipogon TaxID=4529 RepID=A0A0E0QVS3_ORYRU